MPAAAGSTSGRDCADTRTKSPTTEDTETKENSRGLPGGDFVARHRMRAILRARGLGAPAPVGEHEARFARGRLERLFGMQRIAGQQQHLRAVSIEEFRFAARDPAPARPADGLVDRRKWLEPA